MLSLSLSGVLSGVWPAGVMTTFPAGVMAMRGVAPSSPVGPGVLKGVARTVFGVATTWCFGVMPVKSELFSGVFKPPFNGVSTLVKARMFCASCQFIKYQKTTYITIWSENEKKQDLHSP